MAEGEIVIVAIVFGSIVSVVFLGVVGSIIKAWVKKGSGKNLSENKEFLAALREFKEKTDRRLSNLEAIVADEFPDKKKSSEKRSEKSGHKSAIELEVENESGKNTKSEKENTKLRNMLNQ